MNTQNKVPEQHVCLCVGESPREHPWKQIGMRVSRFPRSGAWAESSDGENWRYTGVVLPVADNELPGFLR
jgi:hypothetical protein